MIQNNEMADTENKDELMNCCALQRVFLWEERGLVRHSLSFLGFNLFLEVYIFSEAIPIWSMEESSHKIVINLLLSNEKLQCKGVQFESKGDRELQTDRQKDTKTEKPLSTMYF